MKIRNTFAIAFRALLRNPTRALLTMLGIVIGIAAVITMMEIGAGSAASLRATIESMGAGNIMIMPGAARAGGISMGQGSNMTLTPDDCSALLQRCDFLSDAAPLVNARAQVVAGNRNWTPNQTIGTTPSYFTIRNWPLEDGEYFTERDVQSAATVCVVGSTLARELFGGDSPVGHSIRVKNVTFRVVGLLSTKGANMMGFDQDDVLIAPWTTIRQRVAGARSAAASSSTPEVSTSTTYPGGSTGDLYPAANSSMQTNYRLSPRFVYVDQILALAAKPELAGKAEDEIISILRERHRLRPDQNNDFRIRNSAEFLKMLTNTTAMMTNLLLCVALISLIVGGVGIMNIMLVSVTERTREIGLRMAVGARSRDILQQFLIESIVLCLAGGVIGILLGHGAALLVKYQLKWAVEASPGAVVAAVCVSAFVGIAFGFYPAWKASKLDPIDALRYE